MPQTPTYGLPFEHPRDDLPGYTLDGGPAGDQPILAEAVETELARLDNQISALQAQIDALKSRGWQDITPAGGVIIEENTTIQVPAADTYDMIRVYARGSLNGDGFLSMRINADNTTDLHRRMRITFDPSAGTIQIGSSTSGNVWLAFPWSNTANCTAEALLMNTDIPSALSYQAFSTNPRGASNERRMSLTGGDLGFNRTLSSIQFVGTNTTINQVRIWIEGHRV